MCNRIDSAANATSIASNARSAEIACSRHQTWPKKLVEFGRALW